MRDFRRAFLIAALCLPGISPAETHCAVTQPHIPSEADKAFLTADYAGAATLYQAGLASHPGDVELTAGLVHALLRQQKVQEAADAVQSSLAVAPHAAALISLRGEVELRQGMPWVAEQSATESDALDPCNPRNHLLQADLARLSSLFATSREQLKTAHQLDPADPEIRAEWLHTLSLKKRIAETEAYLAAPSGIDEEEARHWRFYLENMKKMLAEPHKACRMISLSSTAEVPFIKIMRDATHMRAFGVAVALNGHSVQLPIDTGASGLLVSRSVADAAGLKPFSETEMSGVGDHGYKPGFSAYVDSIRIGDLEFRDCQVRVLDSQSVAGNLDGLIGADVFSHFLVTLDFPLQKMVLGPLPPRPGESAPATPMLQTSNAERGDPDASAEPVKSALSENAVSAAAGPVAESSTPTPAPKKKARGPYDRYVAPEMKDYTPVYRVGNKLFVSTTLNNSKPKLFVLDTGAWTTCISPQAAREVTKLRADDQLHVRGISGEVENVYVAKKITFRFATMTQKETNVVSFDTSRISKESRMEISGFLGANTLDWLTIRIDYRDGLVKFEYDPKRGLHD